MHRIFPNSGVKSIYIIRNLNCYDMERANYVWECIAEVPVLREAIYQIEQINDTDQLVEELLVFYGRVEEGLGIGNRE